MKRAPEALAYVDYILELVMQQAAGKERVDDRTATVTS
jgi:hypothetical protein